MRTFNFGNHTLELFEEHDVYRVLPFITELFSDEETKRFFVLSEEFSEDMRSFVSSMAQVNTRGIGVDLLIKNSIDDYVGLLTCEQAQKGPFGHCWTVGITIHPFYRHQGYATMVLKDLRNLLRSAPLQTARPL